MDSNTMPNLNYLIRSGKNYILRLFLSYHPTIFVLTFHFLNPFLPQFFFILPVLDAVSF
jgi:hypothetical protein